MEILDLLSEFFATYLNGVEQAFNTIYYLPIPIFNMTLGQIVLFALIIGFVISLFVRWVGDPDD